MLEQRKDGKFFRSKRPAKSKRASSNTLYTRGTKPGRRNVSGPQDGVVQCVFVDSSDGKTVVSPYATDSFNMSTECTSSIPFRDGTPALSLTGSYTEVTAVNIVSSDILTTMVRL